MRRLAHRLDEIGLSGVRLRAGEDTWIGPTATRCLDDVRRAQAAVCRAGAGLREAAARLEREAATRLETTAATRLETTAATAVARPR